MLTKTMEIWQAFIEAQDVITSQYSEPFAIVYKIRLRKVSTILPILKSYTTLSLRK